MGYNKSDHFIFRKRIWVKKTFKLYEQWCLKGGNSRCWRKPATEILKSHLEEISLRSYQNMHNTASGRQIFFLMILLFQSFYGAMIYFSSDNYFLKKKKNSLQIFFQTKIIWLKIPKYQKNTKHRVCFSILQTCARSLNSQSGSHMANLDNLSFFRSSKTPLGWSWGR